MCLTCSCGDYTEKHPQSKSLTWSDIQAAAEDAGITPKACAWNIVRGVNAMSASADDAVVKATEERRYLLMVVYSPHRMPLRGADKKIDVVSPEVLERAAWKYAMKGFGTGMWHEEGHEDEAVCVESYIYRGPTWVVKDAAGSEQVIQAGDWLAGYILSKRAWSLYKEGLIGGVSMQGAAGRKKASPELLARIRSNSL